MGRRRGFTLVEMLVSLGIVLVLMALLLPSLPRARERARQSYCMNNMRQIGTAFVTRYTNVFPLSAGGDELIGSSGPHLDRRLGVCPSDDVDAHPLRPPPWDLGTRYPYSYTINDLICVRDNVRNPPPPLRVSDVRYPSQKILMIDESTETADDALWNWRESLTRRVNVLSNRHDHPAHGSRDPNAGRGNVIFCDGHGEAVERSLMLDPRYYDPLSR